MTLKIEEIPYLPHRASDGHKGSYGRDLIVAGARGMSGAAVLSGCAALVSGAGLVHMAVPREIQDIVAISNPCYTTWGFDWSAPGIMNDLLRCADESDVVAIGPGLGKNAILPHSLSVLLPRIEVPVVLDADALTGLSQLPTQVLENRPKATVLTPHPGEFARLINAGIPDIQKNREELAVNFARDRGCILVLKGHQTIVTDGTRVYFNTTGNPGMATGGSGDVLTGVIAALIGQRIQPYDATVLAVWVHGRAGDLAAAAVGQVSMTALDLLKHLPAAFREREAIR